MVILNYEKTVFWQIENERSKTGFCQKRNDSSKFDEAKIEICIAVLKCHYSNKARMLGS